MSNSEKSAFEEQLSTLPAEQFATVAEKVEAERKRRDNGASEAEVSRRLAHMTDNEFEAWKRNNGC